MHHVRWIALAWMAFGGVGLSGEVQAAAYDLHYSFYVTNTYPGGGPTVCTGQCLIDFAESIGIAPPDDLYGEFYVEANGVSRFYERDGWVDPMGLESYYPSRSGSTQIGGVDWGRIDIYTYFAGGPNVGCRTYQMELGNFAYTCPSLAYGTVQLGCCQRDGLHGSGELGEPVADQEELALFNDPRPPRTSHVVLDGGLALQETQCFCDGFHDRLLLMPFACVWDLPSVGRRDATDVGSS